jgi:hypothetical protein
MKKIKLTYLLAAFMTLQSCTSDLDVVAEDQSTHSEELFATTAGIASFSRSSQLKFDWNR